MTVTDQLGLFVYRADELRQTRLVRTSGLNGDFSIHCDQRGLVYKFPLVDEDDLRSFLLTFRQFLMQKEPVFIRRVLKVASKHIANARLQAAIGEAASAWKRTLTSCGFSLTIHGHAITPEYVLDLFINGHYFHNDSQKSAELKSYGVPDILLVRNQFLNFLVAATMVIIRTRHILHAALRDGVVG